MLLGFDLPQMLLLLFLACLMDWSVQRTGLIHWSPPGMPATRCHHNHPSCDISFFCACCMLQYMNGQYRIFYCTSILPLLTVKVFSFFDSDNREYFVFNSLPALCMTIGVQWIFLALFLAFRCCRFAAAWKSTRISTFTVTWAPHCLSTIVHNPRGPTRCIHSL